MSPLKNDVAQTVTFSISRKRQVSWFDARQLLATSSRALAATIIGSMSGRRELMAALDPEPGTEFDYSSRDKLWIDYIADTGDGWDATTTVFWLAGRDGLLLRRDGAETEQPIATACSAEASLQPQSDELLLKAGELLIFGGDQVYPTASPLDYQQRFTDPLRCARFFQEGGRDLFAIPGNHDWYDGLTSFIRLFCQKGESRRWFGAWRAQQLRSYFAMRLPHHWWLWGVDMALEDDLDPTQYEYFRVQAQKLQDGDRLILCVPVPTWLHLEPSDQTSRSGDKLRLIMEVATENNRKVDIPLVLTGDHHFYARHEVSLAGGDKRHYIVCGGGGAFGLGTLLVPEEVEVPDADGGVARACRAKRFPNFKESVALRRWVVGFALQNWAFSGLLVLAQLITFWLLSTTGASPAADYRLGIDAEQAGWFGRLMNKNASFAELWRTVAEAAERSLHNPELLLWLLLFVLGMVAFADSAAPVNTARLNRWMARAAGVVHASLHIVGAFVCIWLAAKLIGNSALGNDPAAAETRWLAWFVAALLLYFYSGTLFGLYLLLSHQALRMHDQEVFSALAITDFRSFLRMHISEKGLCIYPIGVRRSARRWKAAKGVTLSPPDINIFSKDQKVTVPKDCLRVVDPCEPLRPHLIEGPIEVPAPTRS